MSSESKLVKLIDTDELAKFVAIDDFLALVNNNPPVAFIKDHPIAKGVKYMPIDKVELLLTKIFQEWKVEILREGQLANSLYVTVRLHYKHPITGWTWQDGTGAAPIKTKSGASAADMAAILNDAVMTGLPAAKSYAIKDAAENIGKVFGKDINRKDVMGFEAAYGTTDVKDSISSIKLATNLNELTDAVNQLPADKQLLLANEIQLKRKALAHDANINADNS